MGTFEESGKIGKSPFLSVVIVVIVVIVLVIVRPEHIVPTNDIQNGESRFDFSDVPPLSDRRRSRSIRHDYDESRFDYTGVHPSGSDRRRPPSGRRSRS
jgi:hypothetical protein